MLESKLGVSEPNPSCNISTTILLHAAYYSAICLLLFVSILKGSAIQLTARTLTGPMVVKPFYFHLLTIHFDLNYSLGNWLKSRFHFSFAEYSNPANRNFGMTGG